MQGLAVFGLRHLHLGDRPHNPQPKGFVSRIVSIKGRVGPLGRRDTGMAAEMLYEKPGRAEYVDFGRR